MRAGSHCSPGDVRGCSLVQAVNCPAGERGLSHVSTSVLDQANNLRRLVVPNDDSGVSSSAYPLRSSARRDAQGDSAGPPFPPASPVCGSVAPVGSVLHPCITGRGIAPLHRPSYQRPTRSQFLIPGLSPFRGNGSQHRAIQVGPVSFDFHIGSSSLGKLPSPRPSSRTVLPPSRPLRT